MPYTTVTLYITMCYVTFLSGKNIMKWATKE